MCLMSELVNKTFWNFLIYLSTSDVLVVIIQSCDMDRHLFTWQPMNRKLSIEPDMFTLVEMKTNDLLV